MTVARFLWWLAGTILLGGIIGVKISHQSGLLAPAFLIISLLVAIGSILLLADRERQDKGHQ